MYADIVILDRALETRPARGDWPRRDPGWRQRPLTYLVPEDLRGMLEPGHLVRVPLQTGHALGLVWALPSTVPILDLLPQPEAESARQDVASPDLSVEEIRPIGTLLDPVPLLTPLQMELARWLCDTCLAPLRMAGRVMLPPGLKSRILTLVERQPGDALPPDLPRAQRRALERLDQAGGRAHLGLLASWLRPAEAESVVRAWEEQGVATRTYALVPPKVGPRRVRFVRLLADPDAVAQALPRLGHASRQADILWALAHSDDPLPRLDELADRLGTTASPFRALADRGWIDITPQRTLAVPLLPPGELSNQADALATRAPRQAEVLHYLAEAGTPSEVGTVYADTGASSSILRALEKKDLVHRAVEPPQVLLRLPPEQVLDSVLHLRGAERHRSVLEVLSGTSGRVWVGGIYARTGADLHVLQDLAARGLISLHEEEFDRPQVDPAWAEPQPLTPAQTQAWQAIQEWGIGKAGPIGPEGRMPGFLLMGPAGSGKTEILLRAVGASLDVGRPVIYLVPETDLTPQAARRIHARFDTCFPGRVGVLHGGLSLGRRYAVWERARTGQIDLLIGARSALLAPLQRVGLIVLEDEHDASYKQGEPTAPPRYHARDVALTLGQRSGALVLLSSSTPDLTTYHRATTGELGLLALMSSGDAPAPPAAERPETRPQARLIDLRQELRVGHWSIFSRALQAALGETLDAGQRAILFLNRRGARTFILCRDCGTSVRCPHCDVPLILHRSQTNLEGDHLLCHHCGREQPVPTRCSACGSRRIRFFGLGTQRVVDELLDLLPDARPLRWDRDAALSDDPDALLQPFRDGQADVLVGTAMLAKGLDLPPVALVGIVAADTALHFPDYRATERTFQLLSHVTAHAAPDGRVLIQTYDPAQYAVRAAAEGDYASFARQELVLRRRAGYPPFARLLRLLLVDPYPRRARREAERMGRWLHQEIKRLELAQVDLIGPVPCFRERLRGAYRWHVVLRFSGPDSDADINALLGDAALPAGWQVEVDPLTLL
jgi:primosomal protein N' (replication factor Y)